MDTAQQAVKIIDQELGVAGRSGRPEVITAQQCNSHVSRHLEGIKGSWMEGQGGHRQSRKVASREALKGSIEGRQGGTWEAAQALRADR